MGREVTVNTSSAPAAVGPYAQARRAGDLLFVSGQLGLAPATGEMVSDDVSGQAKQVMANLEAIITAAGLGWRNVVKATIFLTDMNDFATVNGIYAAAFDGLEYLPARACVQVAALPKGGKVEIEAICHCPES